MQTDTLVSDLCHQAGYIFLQSSSQTNIKHLSVIFDSSLGFGHHSKQLVQNCFNH